MSQDRYRDIIAVAASACTRPKAVPMEPGNAQSGVTRGNYYVTNDSWNAQHYSGLSQTLSSAITITGTPFPP